MFHKRERFIADSFFLKDKPKLEFIKLDLNALGDSQISKWLQQVAEWSECKWGYMRQFPGVDARLQLITDKIKGGGDFYFAVYKSELIGTFSLTPEKLNQEKERSFAKKKKYYVAPLDRNEMSLSYFYIHDNFREFGFGSQMLDKAKELAKNAKLTLTAHVLTPNLYGFYKKRDATFNDEEVRSLGQPCALIRF